MVVSGQYHALDDLQPRRNPCTHGIRGWVGLIAGLDVLGKIITVLPLTGFAHRIFQPVA